MDIAHLSKRASCSFRYVILCYTNGQHVLAYIACPFFTVPGTERRIVDKPNH